MKTSFFITATDTDVGKTFISKGLARVFCEHGKSVGYFKPFQSGVVEGEKTDTQIVESFCGNNVKIKNSYITKTPAAPSLSAEIEGIGIDLNKVEKDYKEFERNLDVTIIEGSGGLFVPVTHDKLMSDVIALLDIPVLVVARPDLGTVNHTLMTLKCLENQNAKILGVVISNFPISTNNPSVLNAKKMIEEHSEHKMLAQIPKNAQTEDFIPLANLLEAAARQYS